MRDAPLTSAAIPAVGAGTPRECQAARILLSPAIADLLVERGLGVRRLPIYLLDIDVESFDLEND